MIKSDLKFLIVSTLPRNKAEYESLGVQYLRKETIRQLPDGTYVIPWDDKKKPRPEFSKDVKTKVMTEDQLLVETRKQERDNHFDALKYALDNAESYIITDEKGNVIEEKKKKDK